MSTQTSSFRAQILDVLAEREAVSVSEITRALSDLDQASEEVVEAYLRYGISDRVEKLESGKWKRKTASPREELETEPTGEPDDSARGQVAAAGGGRESERQSEGPGTASNPLVDEFLHLLSRTDDEPMGLAALARRLRDRGYDVTFPDARELLEELEGLMGQPRLTEWMDEERAFSISEDRYRLAEGFRTASKLILLLEEDSSAFTTGELHQVLKRAGQDVPPSELEYVLQVLLDGIATVDKNGKWCLREGRDIDLSETSTSQREEGRESLLTPDEFISQIEEWLDSSDQAIIPSAWITRQWAPKTRDVLTEAEAKALSGFLEGFGFGIEPDIRYDGNPSKCEHVVVFRDEGEEEDHPRFDAARLLLELGATVASADEEISDDEERRIERHLEEALYLSSSERARLRAHLERRLNHPADIEEVRTRVQILSENDRHLLAQFLITIAGADGIVHREEVDLLQKIYRFLGFDEGMLEADLRELSAPVKDREESLATVLEGTERKEYEIPEEERTSSNADSGEGGSEEQNGLQLDEEKVGEIQSSTRDAAELLQGIFDDPEQECQSRGLQQSELESSHVSLVSTLQKQSRWSRDEFERLAEEHNLMPGFAFERINDVAFDKAEEPLLEGNDPIELNSYALEILKA
jgi:uncharacterized tellurite resistance protein B-like protein